MGLKIKYKRISNTSIGFKSKETTHVEQNKEVSLKRQKAKI